MLKPTLLLTSAAAALALAAGPAQARPAVDPPVSTGVAQPAAVAAPATTSADDFDLGSAAIGAGGMAGLVVLLAGAATVTRRARPVPTR